MGRSSTATVAYGIIIPQSDVLKLLQKLQNSTKEITRFGWGNDSGPDVLEGLLKDYLAAGKLSEETFGMAFLCSGSDVFNGLAILCSEIESNDVTLWGMEGKRRTHYMISV